MHDEENLHELIAELEIIVRLTYVGDCQNPRHDNLKLKEMEHGCLTSFCKVIKITKLLFERC